MNRFLVTIILFCLCVSSALATHNRAGEITYRQISGLTFEFTITTYTKASSVDADRSSLPIFWGDGTGDTLPRFQEVFLPNDIKLNRYRGIHTYSGAFTYVVYFVDPNRIENIINISNSINVLFYVEDTLKILDPTLFGFNSSPVLLNPPIDFGNVGEVFVHNPNAFDPNGDSLSYRLITPKQGVGLDVPGYIPPNQISPGPDNSISINPRTGELIWDAPQQQGIYNIAILVTEYRNGQVLGTVLRDLQIIVQASPNRTPVLSGKDLICVIAGDSIREIYNAIDANPGTLITIDANGAPFIVTPSPAVFEAQPPANPVSGTFRWKTVCEHLRNTEYQIIVRATDNASTPLTDLKTVQIKVVAPAPKNLNGVFNTLNNSVLLRWDSLYSCAGLSKFIGFSVWRKNGCGFSPDPCNTDLRSFGYTKIGETSSYFFTDNNLKRGNDYSYVVVAEFADKSQIGLLFNKFSGLGSQEFCLELPLNLPVMYNADVKVTNPTQGKIFVEWSKPRAAALDTLLNLPPYVFKLYRGNGLNGNEDILLKTVTANSYAAIRDTSYTDTLLNSTAQAYNYKVEFYVNTTLLLGATDKASSVFLSLVPSDKKLRLTWDYNVPWVNDSFVVFRQNKQTLAFDSIATVVTNEYIDSGLSNDSTYCYKIKAIGRYTTNGLKQPLINFSQEACGNPKDTMPPCAPLLKVENACSNTSLPKGELKNYLSWSLLTDCKDSLIVKYYVYFKNPSETSYAIIDSTIGKDSKAFVHTLESSLSGCYVITAIDEAGNESVVSNEICLDDCPDYTLPNAFTPNGDNQNDLYTPIIPFSGVTRINMKILNRWGDLVFETSNPEINWNGRDIKNDKELPAGVYYYVCEVYFNTANGGEQKLKEPLQGYIHLFKAK